MMPHLMLGDRRISALNPTYVIAEIGVNHNGSAQLAHDMIDAAAQAGADAVKFQTFRTEDLILTGTPKADYQQDTTGDGGQESMLKALELPIEVFADLKEHCREAGVDFMSTAFDHRSLDAVGKLDPICLKWPSGELNNTPLLRQAAGMGFPILLSTGMGSITEISAAIDTLTAGGCEDIVILQCVSNYPARIEDQNLRAMQNMAQVFGRPVGFSDHTIGPYAAIAARALGMAILEKHFTMDCKMDGPDHSASIEPREFADMVTLLRQIEAGLGNGVKRPLSAEDNIKKVARKSLVYSADFAAGHLLAPRDLIAKRPGSGIAPNHVDSFLGLPLKTSVKANDLVKRNDV
ncbi:MAG: N-acetylneuraminate synthase family protein [Halocynthiibacter sp.]